MIILEYLKLNQLFKLYRKFSLKPFLSDIHYLQMIQIAMR